MLASDGIQWTFRGKSPWQHILASGWAKKRGAVTSMRVPCEKEDGRVEIARSYADTDPIGIRIGEAEVAARVVAFESSIYDKVFASVPAWEGNLKISLASVDGSRRIGNKEILSKGG